MIKYLLARWGHDYGIGRRISLSIGLLIWGQDWLTGKGTFYRLASRQNSQAVPTSSPGILSLQFVLNMPYLCGILAFPTSLSVLICSLHFSISQSHTILRHISFLVLTCIFSQLYSVLRHISILVLAFIFVYFLINTFNIMFLHRWEDFR